MDTSTNKKKENKSDISSFIEVSKLAPYKNSWNNIFISVEESSEDNTLSQKLSDILEYFQSTKEEDIIQEEGINIAIYELNKMTEFYKLGDFNSLIKIFKEIVQKYPKLLKISLFYLNALFLLIEMAISKNQSNLAFKILAKLTEVKENFKANLPEENSEFIQKFFLSSNKELRQYLSFSDKFFFDKNNVNEMDQLISNFIMLFEVYAIMNSHNENKNEILFANMGKVKNNILKEENLISRYNKEKLTIYFKCLKVKTLIEQKDKMSRREEMFNMLENSNSVECNLNIEQIEKYLNSLKFTQKSNLRNQNKLDIFKMNSLGIMCLKLRRYELAKYHFCKLHKLIKDSNLDDGVYYLNCALYNIALCHFYLKEYEKCYKILSQLKTTIGMKDNPYIYYRIALCCIERAKEKINALKNNNFLISKNIKDKSYSKKCIGVVLVNSEIQKKNKNTPESPNDAFICEAIENLKQCIILLQGGFSFKKELFGLKEIIKVEQNEEEDLFIKSDQQNHDWNYDYLSNSCIIYLLYCLIMTENYSEIEIYSTNFLSKTKGQIFDKTRIIIGNYLTYAYLKLNKVKYALNLLMKQMTIMEKRKDSEDDMTVLSGTLNSYTINKWKIILYVNITKIHFFKNDIREARKYFNLLLNLLGINQTNCEISEIPGYVLNIATYYFIITDNKPLAYFVIMHRKIPKQLFSM
ncbi:MAG: CDC27 family protein [archaeon]|nr:CDC27 family protein [archaeon]